MFASTLRRPLPRFIPFLADRLARHRSRHAAEMALEDLARRDDALLVDIGLHRDDIAEARRLLTAAADDGLSGEAVLRYLDRMTERRSAAGG